MVECNRTLEQAKRDFAQGLLTGAILVRVPMSKSEWSLRLIGKKGDAGMLLNLQDLQTCVFKSADKAVQALEQIGFAFDQLKLA